MSPHKPHYTSLCIQLANKDRCTLMSTSSRYMCHKSVVLTWTWSSRIIQNGSSSEFFSIQQSFQTQWHMLDWFWVTLREEGTFLLHWKQNTWFVLRKSWYWQEKVRSRNHCCTGKAINIRLLLKCDGTRAKYRLRLSAKRTNPFKSAGGVNSVDYWQPRCANQR